jgi:Flp pilus assembly protein TadB
MRKQRIYNKFNNISIKPKKTLKKNANVFRLKFIDYFFIYLFSKSSVIKNYSKKYNKYNFSNEDNFPMLCFINKVKVGFLCLCIYLIISLLDINYFSLGASFLVFIIGSYLVDLSLEVKYRDRIKEIDESLYKAVSLLKASFNSGKTINQGIKYLTEELDGALKEEFLIIKNDIDCGLSLEESFNRLNQKYDIENLKYVYSSLSLTSKTGGNIVDILDMMDNELLIRRKLRDEYISVTGVSRLIYKVLLLLPILIFMCITFVEHTYFLPFVTTRVGVIILLSIIFLYLLYIDLMAKILKGCYND